MNGATTNQHNQTGKKSPIEKLTGLTTTKPNMIYFVLTKKERFSFIMPPSQPRAIIGADLSEIDYRQVALEEGGGDDLRLPFVARLEAFINAILSAPVRLAPKPKRIANAGTNIIDATARPVPNNKDPSLFFSASVRTNS